MFTFQKSLHGKAFRVLDFLHHYFTYNRDNKRTLWIWWAFVTRLHIEQGQTSVTEKRRKKTKTTHCWKGSWMLLYSVVKAKQKQTQCQWHCGMSRGQTWTDKSSFLVCGHQGETERKPYEGIPMLRISVETKHINMADSEPWWKRILRFKLDATVMVLNNCRIRVTVSTEGFLRISQ